MFGRWQRLPIDFVFPTHEVMGTLRPVDSYVAELNTALRKGFEVAQNMTQVKSLNITLNKGDVVFIRNDQFVRKRKLKDCWGDRYTQCATKLHGCTCVHHQKSVRSKANPSLKSTLPNQEG